MTGDAWKESGMADLAGRGFSLYQAIAAARMDAAEYAITDEAGREIGRYTGGGRKSATLTYGGARADLYIQGGTLGGTEYAGKVGGSANNSIVIRDGSRLIAEAWRVRVVPAAEYRCVFAGRAYEVAAGGLWPTRLGTITSEGEQVGAFRRPAALSRNLFLAFRGDMNDELKVCLCALCLLQ